MKHYQAFAGQRNVFLDPECRCNGELALLGTFADTVMGEHGPVDRTVYLHLCRSCGYVVTLARDHELNAPVVPIGFELLNTYRPSRRVVTKDVKS
ncbi:MAG TPA: hypothetical protein V6D47_00355 [Oscillatoriaceae cyanobacterium]